MHNIIRHQFTVYIPFSQQIFRIIGKAQVLLITSTMALFNSSVAVSRESVSVSRHQQCQEPETEAAKINSAVIHFVFTTHYMVIQTFLKLERQGATLYVLQ